MNVAEVAASIEVIIEKAHELGAPRNGYFTIHWVSSNYNGYIEVYHNRVVKNVEYKRGTHTPIDESMAYIPPKARITSICKGYIGETIYSA